MQEHTTEEVASAIAPYFPDTETDLIVTVLNRYKAIDVWSTSPYISEDSFELLQTVIHDAGELKEKAPYSKVINNDFANKVINK